MVATHFSISFLPWSVEDAFVQVGCRSLWQRFSGKGGPGSSWSRTSHEIAAVFQACGTTEKKLRGCPSIAWSRTGGRPRARAVRRVSPSATCLSMSGFHRIKKIISWSGAGAGDWLHPATVVRGPASGSGSPRELAGGAGRAPRSPPTRAPPARGVDARCGGQVFATHNALPARSCSAAPGHVLVAMRAHV